MPSVQASVHLTEIPLLRAPSTWPVPVVATVAMLLLALLDLAGAVYAKSWAETGSHRSLVAGVLLFLLLFWVYASSLRYSELATVTFGWVVILQVGVLLLDRFRYDIALPPAKWVAMGAILALQAYLILAPNHA